MQLHRDIFGEAFPEEAGRLRTETIDVAGDSCSAPEHIGAHLADFCTQLVDQLGRVEANPYDNEELFQTRIELVAWAHVQLLAIHPFIDGNGRVARLLLNLMLRRFGLFPVNVRLEDGYFGHLRAARIRGEPAGLVAMLIRLVSTAVEEFEQSILTRERTSRRRRRRHSR